jgi:hypothetical protein
MLNPIAQAVHQIVTAHLSDTSLRAGLRLLDMAGPATGHVTLTWETAAALFGCRHRGSIRRHLGYLQAAGVIHYSTNGMVFVTFLAWAQVVTAEAVVSETVGAETSAAVEAENLRVGAQQLVRVDAQVGDGAPADPPPPEAVGTANAENLRAHAQQLLRVGAQVSPHTPLGRSLINLTIPIERPTPTADPDARTHACEAVDDPADEPVLLDLGGSEPAGASECPPNDGAPVCTQTPADMAASARLLELVGVKSPTERDAAAGCAPFLTILAHVLTWQRENAERQPAGLAPWGPGALVTQRIPGDFHRDALPGDYYRLPLYLAATRLSEADAYRRWWTAKYGDAAELTPSGAAADAEDLVGEPMAAAPEDSAPSATEPPVGASTQTWTEVWAWLCGQYVRQLPAGATALPRAHAGAPCVVQLPRQYGRPTLGEMVMRSIRSALCELAGQPLEFVVMPAA